MLIFLSLNNFIYSSYASCIRDDSIEGIFTSVKESGVLCRDGGKVGLNVSTIRSHGSYIAGTNGNSNGLVPMLRVFNQSGEIFFIFLSISYSLFSYFF